MNQIIIAMSGRKQAGKNSIGQFICEHYAKQALEQNPNASVAPGMENMFLAHTFQCSFADSLKDFCVDTLGLPREACYGTDEEKKLPTEYDWADAPKFLRWKFGDGFARQMVAEGKTQNELMIMYFERMGYRQPTRAVPPCPVNPVYMDGKMTGRDIMQIFGTDLIRQTFGNVWARATIRRIKKEGKPFSVITDNRFPNEIEAVLAEPKGFIIRLTRSPFGLNDVHPSESALDSFEWDRGRCFVLDNVDMTIDEQNKVIQPILNEILEY